MSGHTNRQPSLLLLRLLLLLCISCGSIASSSRLRLSLPRRQLLAPRFPFVESFEIFDDSSAEDDEEPTRRSTRTGDQLTRLLGQQLTNAVVPLTAAPLAVLSQRRPGIVAPISGAQAAQLFGDSAESEESSEEDSDEADAIGDANPDTGAGPPQLALPVAQPGSQPVSLPGSQLVTQPVSQFVPQPVVQPGSQFVPQPVVQPVSQFVPQPVVQPVPQLVPQSVAQGQLQTDYNPYRDNFNDRYADGSYVFGYALPNGVRRWERGFFSGHQHGLVVEGFYAEPRHYGHSVRYELRCYRADAHGYHPFPVEYLQQPPPVRRFELPNVSCLNYHRQLR